jgi:hypothetical protein
LEEIVGWNSNRIRALFESQGLVLQEWDKVRTDTLRISSAAHTLPDALAAEIQ